MKICPKCGERSVSFDGYRGVERCLIDGCTCIVENDESYSILKKNDEDNTMNRVQIMNGVEVKTLKRISLE